MVSLPVRSVVVAFLAFLAGMAVAVAAHAQAPTSLLGVSTETSAAAAPRRPRINLEGTGSPSVPPPPPPPVVVKQPTWRERIAKLLSGFVQWVPELIADAKKWWRRIVGGGAA